MTVRPSELEPSREPLVASRLEQEALRIYRRYAVEVVEAFDVCPFAATARARGHVREWVSLDAAPTVDTVLPLVREASVDPQVEIGLLIFPLVDDERLAFERFVSELQRVAQRMGKSDPSSRLSAMAMAAFHPSATAVLDDAARLVPFLRRTPDPTIQLVRKSVLDKLRGQTPRGTAFVDPSSLDFATLAAAGPHAAEKLDISDRIARTNLRTVERCGVAAFERIFADIARDRAAAYAPLLTGLGQ